MNSPMAVEPAALQLRSSPERRAGSGRKSACQGAISLAVVAGLLATMLPAPVRAEATSANAAAAPVVNFKDCATGDDTAFRGEIERITKTALEVELGRIDYTRLVDEQWQKTDMNQLIDRLVTERVAAIREDKTTFQLVETLWDSESRQALATTVVERVYQSEGFRLALEDLATDIALKLGDTINTASAKIAEPSMECLRAFLGPRYGGTVAQVVGTDARSNMAVDTKTNRPDVSGLGVLADNRDAIIGAIIIALRRTVAQNLARQFGQRVIGAVVGRLLSTLSGVLGLALIAKDVWQMRHGVLPTIEEEMKSDEAKAKIREELTLAIQKGATEQIGPLAKEAAKNIYDLWINFEKTFNQILAFAKDEPKVRTFIDSFGPAKFRQVNDWTGLALVREDRAGVLKRIEDGTLGRAITTHTESSIRIARDLGSIDGALAWADAAGPLLDAVVVYNIHWRAKSTDFTLDGLKTLLALDDRPVITRLLQLEAAARDQILTLKAADAKLLVRRLDEQSLTAIADYLRYLPPDAAQMLTSDILADPSLVERLKGPILRKSVIRSAEPERAIRVLLRADSLWDLSNLPADFALVRNGQINPYVFWSKHPIASSVGLFAAFLILMMVLRMVRPRRGRVRPANTGPTDAA